MKVSHNDIRLIPTGKLTKELMMAELDDELTDNTTDNDVENVTEHIATEATGQSANDIEYNIARTNKNP